MSDMPSSNVEIFIADDDLAVRDALAVVFTLARFRVASFGDGPSLLAAAGLREPACILLDVQMPGPSGLDILKELNARNCRAPIFIMSAYGRAPLIVDAIRNGAVDFIQKPFDATALVSRVREVLAARNDHNASADAVRRFPGCEMLTRRERQVVELIIGGASNKEAGRALGISPRTVEVYRARIMDKLGAKNAADLVRIVLGAHRRS